MATLDELDRIARDFVTAFDTRDEAALQRLNRHYRRDYTLDDLGAEIWRRVYAYRQRSCAGSAAHLRHDEAQTLVAQDNGYPSWLALAEGLERGTPGVEPYAIDSEATSISPSRRLTDADWDALIALMAEQRIAALESSGLMTNAVLARISRLPHVTTLRLDGSRQVTNQGLRHLANMPQRST